jgi:hypothetical protein
MSPPDKIACPGESHRTRGIHWQKPLDLRKYPPELRGEPDGLAGIRAMLEAIEAADAKG